METQNSEKELEKQAVAAFLLRPVKLHAKNRILMLQMGVVNALMLAALIAVSYYVEERTVMALTMMMPAVDFFMARYKRVRTSAEDCLFHEGWSIVCVFLFILAFSGWFAEEFPVNGVFLMYMFVELVALALLFVLTRLNYASAMLVGSVSFIYPMFSYSVDPECSIQLGLVMLSLFNFWSFILAGAVMNWQVKNQVKNPINFPQHAK